MITHNGTYLLHATHHGMPIVAATMGGKMVIGLLLSATLQAIVAAFGAEGTEVIRKTNDYLNRIATTDPQRALLLANFINEDPMLVCSLVETSKMRWLKSDGFAYIDTGFKPTLNTCLHIKGYWGDDTIFNDYNTNAGLAYTDNGATGNNGFGFNLWGDTLYVGYGGFDTVGSVKKNVIYEFVLDKGDYSVKSAEVERKGVLSANSLSPNSNLLIFAWARSGGVPYKSKMYMSNVELNDDTSIHLVPCHHDNQAGMLDIISGTFYPNANTQGSFTIALTLKTTS